MVHFHSHNMVNLITYSQHAALFTGIAIGPILAGKLVGYTKNLILPFYISAVAHVLFVLFVLFVIPESLTKERQLAAQEKRRAQREITLEAALAHGDRRWSGLFRPVLEVFAPLKILWPTGPGSSAALRRNLVFLAMIDTIIFGIAMGVLTVVVLYSELTFGWQTDDTSTFVSIANIGRVSVLVGVLPLLNRLLRRKVKKDPSSTLNRGSDRIDLVLIQVSIFFDVLGYIGYATSKTPGMFIASALVASGGSIASPTVESSMTRHVPSDRVGQILGAVGLLHALGRIAGPTIFNLIYEKTVVTVPQTVFIVITAFFGTALLFSFFLRTDGELNRNINASIVVIYIRTNAWKQYILRNLCVRILQIHTPITTRMRETLSFARIGFFLLFFSSS